MAVLNRVHLLPHQVHTDLLNQWASEQEACCIEVEANLDIAFLRNQIDQILSRHSPMVKDEVNGYSGLCLQYREGEDPIYGALQNDIYGVGGDRGLQKKARLMNEIGISISDVFNFLPHLELTRGRVLIAEPNFKHYPHSDGYMSWRLHIPLRTNEASRFHYEDSNFHMPANGNAFIVNTEKTHWVSNESKVDRMHLVFDVR